MGELLVRANGVVHDRGEVGGHVNLVVRAHEIGGGASGVAILVRLKTAVQLLVHRLGDFGPGGVVNAGRAGAAVGEGHRSRDCRSHSGDDHGEQKYNRSQNSQLPHAGVFNGPKSSLGATNHAYPSLCAAK